MTWLALALLPGLLYLTANWRVVEYAGLQGFGLGIAVLFIIALGWALQYGCPT